MKNNIKLLLIFINLILLCCVSQKAHTQITLTDSTSVNKHEVNSAHHNMNDSLSSKVDTSNVDGDKHDGLGIDAEVKYTAKDSIIMSMDGSKKVFLYGDANVKYQDIELTAAYIELDLDSSMTYAKGIKDSTGVEKGLPVFKDKSGSYEMRTIKYNFKTKKAIIEHVVTEQGEGYIVSKVAKKAPDNSFCIKNGHYSTCDHHDHPHFYLDLTKAKVIPGKKIITGPAYLVIEDVPLYPIGIPFGFVPTTSKYSSGILFPSYGEESTRGLFLKDGGYYWAASDYFDLAVRGDLYANSSWAIRASTKYKNRYKYGGNFNLQYIENVSGDKDIPNTYLKTRDFSITWSHRQDSKANPYSTFSASVNYSTSSFDRHDVNSVIDPSRIATNTKRSSISYSRRFPNSPFNISANILASQNSRDTSLNVTAPDLTITMSRIFPFKRKNRVGKEAWYEKLSLSYTGNTKNYIDTKEYAFGDKSFPRDWQNGVKHNIPISMNLKLLKYFTLTPNFNYTERWYSSSIKKGYNPSTNSVVTTDTTYGFNRVWDYNFGASASTKIYTFYKPWRKLFGNKISAIRHVMTPSASLSYRPDFGDPKYGYYDSFEYYDKAQNKIVNNEYSRYEGSIFGTPGKGKSGNLGLSLGNTLEMKVRSDKDTSGFKKIKILESLNFSTSHNFLADSLKWSAINMTGRTKILGTNINFGAVFDPYALDTTATGMPVRINKSYYKATGIPLRLETANFNFGLSFSSEKLKKWRDKRNGKKTDDNKDKADEDDPLNPIDQDDPNKDVFKDSRDKTKQILDNDGYTKFDIPWNLSLDYSFRLVNVGFDKKKMLFKHKVTSDINLNGDFSLTSKWKFSFSSGYNFDLKEISHTNLRISRDLHCWGMSFNVVPVGRYKSYYFSLRVNSSLLKDLKLDKRSSPRDNPDYY